MSVRRTMDRGTQYGMATVLKRRAPRSCAERLVDARPRERRQITRRASRSNARGTRSTEPPPQVNTGFWAIKLSVAEHALHASLFLAQLASSPGPCVARGRCSCWLRCSRRARAAALNVAARAGPGATATAWTRARSPTPQTGEVLSGVERRFPGRSARRVLTRAASLAPGDYERVASSCAARTATSDAPRARAARTEPTAPRCIALRSRRP